MRPRPRRFINHLLTYLIINELMTSAAAVQLSELQQRTTENHITEKSVTIMHQHHQHYWLSSACP